MHVESSYALLLMAIRPEKREPLMEAAEAYVAAKEEHESGRYRMDAVPELFDKLAFQVCAAAGANKSEKFPRFAKYAGTTTGARILLTMAMHHANPSPDDQPLSPEEEQDANHPSAMLERIKDIYDAALSTATRNHQLSSQSRTGGRGI